MSTKKKGILCSCKEWAKHLRNKKPFWSSHRQATKKHIQKSLNY